MQEPWELLAKGEDPNKAVPGRAEALLTSKEQDVSTSINVSLSGSNEKSKKKKSSNIISQKKSSGLNMYVSNYQ